VTGRLIGWEPIGTQRDGAQLIGVEALDGKIWTARVARPENLRELGGVERGAIIELERGAVSLKPSDRTIWEIARENDGIYSRALHLELRPGDRAPYLDMLERRLEALRREGLVERDRAGNFTLPSNYLDRALAREGQGGRESARVSLIDPHSVENQIRYRGPTWLDRLSDGEADSAQLGRTGFGGKVRDALSQRETALRGIEPDQRRDHLVELEYRDLAARIERQTGKAVIFAQEGDKVQGLYQGRIIMAERSYAMIERDHNVQLAPWRPEMDRARHQQIVGQVRDYQLDFKYGKAAERTLKRGLGLGIDL
jgi:hypothetical protein